MPPSSSKSFSISSWVESFKIWFRPKYLLAFSQKKLKYANQKTKYRLHQYIRLLSLAEKLMANPEIRQKAGKWKTFPKLRFSNLYLLKIYNSYFYLNIIKRTKIIKLIIDFLGAIAVSKGSPNKKTDIKEIRFANKIKTKKTKSLDFW